MPWRLSGFLEATMCLWQAWLGQVPTGLLLCAVGRWVPGHCASFLGPNRCHQMVLLVFSRCSCALCLQVATNRSTAALLPTRLAELMVVRHQ